LYLSAIQEDEMDKKKYLKGDIILEEGTKGEEIFFIISGRVRVYKLINNEKIDLAMLGPDDFFGEMSMFLQSKRSATIEALEDSEILVSNRAGFISAIRTNPNQAIRIISTMAKRLKDAHKVISRLEGERKSYEILLAPFGR